jgi:hypothetical protein
VVLTFVTNVQTSAGVTASSTIPRRIRDRIPTRSRRRFWIMANVLRFSPWSVMK